MNRKLKLLADISHAVTVMLAKEEFNPGLLELIRQWADEVYGLEEQLVNVLALYLSDERTDR